jgi:DNA-binding XRE family transcriptional regulator
MRPLGLGASRTCWTSRGGSEQTSSGPPQDIKMSDDEKDAPDVRAHDEANRRLVSGEDELIPAEFANRIIDGESPVRVWREYRGLTTNELAARAGISEADLGQIESGDRSRVETLKRIAVVLNVDTDDLN